MGEMADIVTEAKEDAISRFRGLKLNPVDRAEDAVRRFADYPTHSSKAAAKAARIAEFRDSAASYLQGRDENGLDREIRKLMGDRGRFVEAAPEPTQRDQFLRTLEVLWGRSGAEIDALFTFAVGKKIGRIEWNGVEVDGEFWTRESIRLRLRPQWSDKSDREWILSMGPIREIKTDTAGQRYLGADSLDGLRNGLRGPAGAR